MVAVGYLEGLRSASSGLGSGVEMYTGSPSCGGHMTGSDFQIQSQQNQQIKVIELHFFHYILHVISDLVHERQQVQKQTIQKLCIKVLNVNNFLLA